MDRERDPLPSSDLVYRAQKGDREAFDVLAERHRGRLLSLARLRLGTVLGGLVEAEDIVQMTFLRAFESIGGFEWQSPGCFYRWLAGICRHVVQDLARRYLQTEKRGPTREVSLETLVGGVDGDGATLKDILQDTGTSPSDAMRRNERFDRLRNALGKLSNDHREVILLARLEGLPIKEIAARMGRSPDAVSMLLLRALRELRTHFGGTDSFRSPCGAPTSPPAGPAQPLKSIKAMKSMPSSEWRADGTRGSSGDS
jgi:RNA polymerase sigma-70 factor (ECF subfamily)